MAPGQATLWIRLCSEALANNPTPEVAEYRLESRLQAFNCLGENREGAYAQQVMIDLEAEARKAGHVLPNLKGLALDLTVMLDLVWHYGVNPAFLLGTSRQAFIFPRR